MTAFLPGPHGPPTTPAPCNPLQAYLFDIRADEIAEAAGGTYSGPGLVVDASEHCNHAAFANCVFGSGMDSNLLPKVRAGAMQRCLTARSRVSCLRLRVHCGSCPPACACASAATWVVCGRLQTGKHAPADRRPNMASRLQTIWDPVEKRPHMALLYTGEEPSLPGEELLLDYGFKSYWADGVRSGCWLGAAGGLDCGATCAAAVPPHAAQLLQDGSARRAAMGRSCSRGCQARDGSHLQAAHARHAHEEFAELAGEVRCTRQSTAA